MPTGRPPLLSQNSELAPDRIWNYSIPAWYVDLPDGRRFVTCRSAGPCTQVCYARNGTYRFPVVLEKHTQNLTRYLDDPGEWLSDLMAELAAPKFRRTRIPREIPGDVDPAMRDWVEEGGAAVRIHDSGDFFSLEYLRDWLHVARLIPDVLFYAYTKEVILFEELDPGEIPPNFRYLYSTGGRWDYRINVDTDRHADVFETVREIEEAGYTSQDASDLLAILLPTTRVGIPANRIPHFLKKLAGRRFSELVPETRRLRPPGSGPVAVPPPRRRP